MTNKTMRDESFRWRMGWLIFLLAFFLLMPAEPSFAAGYPCQMPDCPTSADSGGGKALTRTFTLQGAKSGTGFELTREDFLRIFAIGREVHINLSPEGEIYEMNIGFTDTENAQVWQLPDIPFEGPSIWVIMEPAATPHASLFPEATHALVTMNDQINEGTVYQYYNFAETALILLGEAWEMLGGAPVQTFQYDFQLALFPLNTATSFTHDMPVNYFGADARHIQEVAMHGFGPFELSAEETLEAGAFFNDIIFTDPDAADPYDPNAIIDFDTGYSIFGTDGTWFQFYIADPPTGDSTAIQGDVYIEDVEYWRVVDATTTAIEDETPPETPTWSVYPNPATDVIHFSEPTSVSLYDVLGRMVGKGTSVQHLDVSTLTPGMYLVRSELGQSKTIVVQ